MTTAYDELIERIRDIARLGAVEALLDWDQEVMMPPRGVEPRAQQMALVAGLAHERLTDDRVGDLLVQATSELDGSDDGSDPAGANLREIRRAYDRATRLPTALVKRVTAAAALARDAWVRARDESDFPAFGPHLDGLLELKHEVAERIGYDTEPYDALLDEYEPGARAAEIETLFSELGDATAALLRRIQDAPRRPEPAVLTRDYALAAQRTLSRELAESLGFDFESGRADVSVHPFCTTIGGPRDVRVTTRYQPDLLPSAMYGTLHEVGHALYEQGLPDEHAGTPLGEAVSLGIHESQSRLWENLVGRGRPFLQAWYPRVQALFPEALGDVALADFYAALNHVTPSCIRIEADELTYNLHIVLRFEIERELLAGRLAVADVPQRWDERMAALLGITPPDDAAGCLQDIHWSMGAFGYFPTYALGNLYAAQFYAQAVRDLGGLDDDLARGQTARLLDWLREHIHVHGQRYRAHVLVERVTGTPLSIEPFMNHVTAKFSEIYGL